MIKYIAILRGINVGGKHKILMADLRLLIESLGFSNVKTYIQSGNLIFEAKKGLVILDMELLIENAILNQYGFVVPIIIRTTKELRQIFDSNLFIKDNDITQLCVTFLKKKPSYEDTIKTNLYKFDDGEFNIVNKEIFICFKGKYHKSKLTNNFFEKKLQVSATTRNWRTISKLVELSK